MSVQNPLLVIKSKIFVMEKCRQSCLCSWCLSFQSAVGNFVANCAKFNWGKTKLVLFLRHL